MATKNLQGCPMVALEQILRSGKLKICSEALAGLQVAPSQIIPFTSQLAGLHLLQKMGPWYKVTFF